METENQARLEPAPLEKLRELLPVGTTVFWNVKATSRGNASSVLDFHTFAITLCATCDGRGATVPPLYGPEGEHHAFREMTPCPACNGRRGDLVHLWLSRMIVNLAETPRGRSIGGRWDAKHEGIRVGGHNRAGHVVRALAKALHGREDALRMERLG